MTDKELLQQALDALISVWNSDRTKRQVETILAIKSRLAQPKKEWVGLTEDERLEIIAVGGEAAVLYVTEAKLKEKNT